jgi:hypothetical protein
VTFPYYRMPKNTSNKKFAWSPLLIEFLPWGPNGFFGLNRAEVFSTHLALQFYIFFSDPNKRGQSGHYWSDIWRERKPTTREFCTQRTAQFDSVEFCQSVAGKEFGIGWVFE